MTACGDGPSADVETTEASSEDPSDAESGDPTTTNAGSDGTSDTGIPDLVATDDEYVYPEDAAIDFTRVPGALANDADPLGHELAA